LLNEKIGVHDWYIVQIPMQYESNVSLHLDRCLQNTIPEKIPHSLWSLSWSYGYGLDIWFEKM
jgi:hypothetical protein